MFSIILCCLTEAPGNGEGRPIFSFKVLLHSRKPKQPTSPEDGKKESSSLFFPKKNDCLTRNNCYPRGVAINTSWPIIFHPLATWKPDMHKQSHVPGGLRIQKRKSSAFCTLLTGFFFPLITIKDAKATPFRKKPSGLAWTSSRRELSDACSATDLSESGQSHAVEIQVI